MNGTVLQMEGYTPRASRAGWNSDEEQLLFDRVREARGAGRSLKSVFDRVAQETGRKPNSIRNYYYAKAKEDPDKGHSPAFVPFHDGEIRELLVTVLGALAKGVSVRACTLAMGHGDTRAMLRYQNKYRAVLKSNPQLVREVLAQMQAAGQPCVDPYAQSARKAEKARRSAEALSGGAVVAAVAKLVRQAAEAERAWRRVEELEALLHEG